MHMADALLSPSVGAFMIVISAALLVYSAYNMKKEGFDEKKIPIMGVLGAFVFAAQMINITIPGTGSSGHIGGGILLAAVLGPYAALFVLSSVLLIQALFFADGGLLAIGCNIFNMGVCSCLIAYPLLFKPFVKKGVVPKYIVPGSIVAVVVGLLLGSSFVVFETLASGITELPFVDFLLLMLPIHFLIGLVEGVITAGILLYVWKERPELIETSAKGGLISKEAPLKRFMAVMFVLAIVVGAGLSLFASTYPDGLEWAIQGITGSPEIERDGGIYDTAATIVEKTAFMPDYSFKSDGEDGSVLGTSTSGIVGSLLTLILAIALGLILFYTMKPKKEDKSSPAPKENK